jgi:hypothetical protein
MLGRGGFACLPADAVSAFVPLRFVVCDSHVGQGRLRLSVPLTLDWRSFVFELLFVKRMVGRVRLRLPAPLPVA